ncbi:MAG: TRAP transporter small permease subunit [Candidatus Thiodiazotropha sp.]
MEWFLKFVESLSRLLGYFAAFLLVVAVLVVCHMVFNRFVMNLPRFYLALFAYTVSAALCIMLTWYSVGFWHEAWEAGWVSDSIWGPKLWKAYLSMPVGFFAISLQYLADLVCLLNGRDHPFGLEPSTPPEAS